MFNQYVFCHLLCVETIQRLSGCQTSLLTTTELTVFIVELLLWDADNVAPIPD